MRFSLFVFYNRLNELFTLWEVSLDQRLPLSITVWEFSSETTNTLNIYFSQSLVTDTRPDSRTCRHWNEHWKQLIFSSSRTKSHYNCGLMLPAGTLNPPSLSTQLFWNDQSVYRFLYCQLRNALSRIPFVYQRGTIGLCLPDIISWVTHWVCYLEMWCFVYITLTFCPDCQ